MTKILPFALTLAAATGGLAESSRVAVGRPAPAVSVTTAEGGRLDLQSLRGKRVLLFMWASW
jgi:hypothetical protein